MKFSTITICTIVFLIFTSCDNKSKKISIGEKVRANKKVISDTTPKSKDQKNNVRNGEKQLKKFYIRNEKRLKFYGFKDLNGNIVIPAKFKYADNFKNHLAKVFDGTYWGFINKEGNYVVEPKYNYLSHLENHFSLINKNGVDTLGNINELFCQFPETLDNIFKNLPSYKINKMLKPSESYSNLRKYMKNNLEMDNFDIYFLRKSNRDGEGYSSIGFQNLKYGIMFWEIMDGKIWKFF